jgi:hypothetical protein
VIAAAITMIARAITANSSHMAGLFRPKRRFQLLNGLLPVRLLSRDPEGETREMG